MCRIEEDFNATVGQQKDQFKQKLCCEMLGQVQMPRRMIQDIDVSPGMLMKYFYFGYCFP
jgi:hypothetical protein